MRVFFDATAPSWAHAFATLLTRILETNDAKVKALEARIKALEGN